MLGLVGLLLASPPTWAGKAERGEALGAQALALAEAGDLDKAYKRAHKALRRDPANLDAAWTVAVVEMRYMQMVPGDSELVPLLTQLLAASMARVAELDPDGTRGAIARQYLGSTAAGEVLQLPTYDCPPHAEAAMERAEAAFARRDAAGARAAYAEALAACDANASWWVYYGDAAFLVDDYPAALEGFDAAVERYPCHWQAHRFAADALDRMGQYQAAVDRAVQAVSCNPTYAPGWTSLDALVDRQYVVLRLPVTRADDPEGFATYDVALQQQQGEPHERAVAAARAALAADPPQTPLWKALARAEAEGMLEAAVFVQVMDVELAGQFEAWRDEHIQGMEAYIRSLILAPD